MQRCGRLEWGKEQADTMDLIASLLSSKGPFTNDVRKEGEGVTLKADI